MKGNELELSLIETLQKANLSELSADVADTAMEAVGDIPVVGLLYKFWKVAHSIPTYLFAKKVLRFLYELKDVPPEERQAQLARLDVVPGETEKIGETVLLLLDRLNDMQKPAMLGRTFRAYLEGKITFEQFHSLSHAIDALSMSHFAAFERFYKYHADVHWIGPKVSRSSVFFNDRTEENVPLQALAMCGLVSIDWQAETEQMKIANLDSSPSRGPDVVVGGSIAFVPNRQGYLFREIVLKTK